MAKWAPLSRTRRPVSTKSSSAMATGRAYAMAALEAGQLVRLHHEPADLAEVALVGDRIRNSRFANVEWMLCC